MNLKLFKTILKEFKRTEFERFKNGISLVKIFYD